MIELTRLNGKRFVLNCELIQTVEETPDTIVTTTNDKTYVVRESVSDVVGLVASYKARMRDWPEAGGRQPGTG